MNTQPHPPITGLDDLSAESRMLATPWSRIVRGLALGQHPVGHDAAVEALIRKSIGQLRTKTANNDPYTEFSAKLIDLILFTVAPDDGHRDDGHRDEGIRERAVSAVQTIGAIENPYSRAVAGTILIDAMAKLGLDVQDFDDDVRRVVEDTLSAVDAIEPDAIQDENQGRHGDYERLSAFTAVFFAFNRPGLKEALATDGRDRIGEALNTIEHVPTPYFRGRGGSMLIASIALLGEERRLRGDDRDVVESVLEWMDRVDELELYPAFPSSMSPAFIKTYPLLAMLGGISSLDDPSAYLDSGADRLGQASELMVRIAPVERTHMALYYVMALFNLGKLDEQLPKLDSFVEMVVGSWRDIDPGEDYFLSGIAYSYLVQLAYFTGRTDLIVPEMIDGMLGAFRTMEEDDEARANRPYPFAYVVNVLGEIGLGNRLHEPHPGYDGESPYGWVIDHMSENAVLESSRLYMLDHALISWALRLRPVGGPASLGFGPRAGQ